MLATGGLLGLLLMGAAVGGLVTGMDSTDGDDDGDPGREDGMDTADGRAPWDEDTTIDLADWLADLDAQDDAPDAPETAHSGLSTLLFGHAAPAQIDEDAPAFGFLQSARAGAELDAAADAPRDPMMAAEAGLPGTGPHLDVVETVAFGYGPDIPLVNGFDADTDRLILDFPGTAADAPVIGVDLDLSPGDALVLADGVPVTFVAGAATLSSAQIDVVMTGDEAPAEAGIQAGGGAAIGSYETLGVIKGFNPSTQQIEIDYDPAVFAEPQVEILDAEDGSGADILLNGEVVLSVADIRGLDPELVVLRPV
jgi:hypothetical protein